MLSRIIQDTNWGKRMSRVRARFWGLRLSLILFGLLPFVAMEFALRMLWRPQPSNRLDPYLDCSQLSPLFELQDGTYRTSTDRLRLFASTQFSAIKAKGTKRIFCLGGSTTQGEPYKPPTAFPAWLQLNLQLIDPNQSWEVINCGGLSYASYRLLPILIEILQVEPDLVIIDCGHNEFLETRELSGWKQASVIQRNATRFARSSRLVEFASQWVSNRFPARSTELHRTQLKQEVDALLDDQGGLERYNRDDLNVESVVKSMQWNIAAMIQNCKEARVPVVLLVPTSNICDCPPFKAELSQRMDSKTKDQIESCWTSVTQAHAERIKKDSSEAIEVHELQRIISLDPEHAAALYWLGQFELSNGQIEMARQHLVEARDRDVCPLRAVSSMQSSVRELATNEKVWLFDVDALFQSVSNNGMVGDKWLIDHVHPRIEGHQLLGEHLADFLIQKGWVAPMERDWKQHRTSVYRERLNELGEEYFFHGKQRLEGLLMWTQGRASKGLKPVKPR